ncbi:hypothetical protein F4777DRAFT_563920 [Nemania sp. FL0916]|nr:hypothetical protein F4777DRAFT_563920 [Nemania sp. FL0916]
MQPRSIDVLLLEFERQITAASDPSQQNTFGPSPSGGTPVFEDQDCNLYRELKDWFQSLSQCDGIEWEDAVVPPNFQKAVWQLLAFSNSSLPIINSEHQRDRCRDIHDIRRPDGLAASRTEDIWKAPDLRSWITSPVSSSIVIQGNSQTIDSLERFSFEISRELEEIYPTIWMLSEPYSRRFISAHDETEILRQLAIQALRQVSNFKCSFLVDSMNFFGASTTKVDWFLVLKVIFELIPKICVVIDLNILGARINQANSWLDDFQLLISQLSRSSSSKLSVMLLSSRLLARNPHALFVSVTPQLRPPHSTPFRKASLQTAPSNHIRNILTLAPPRGTNGGQAELDAIPPLRQDRGDDLPSRTSTKYTSLSTLRNSESPQYASIREASNSDQQGNIETPKEALNNNLTEIISPAPPHRDEIAIAVICALPLEANAVLSVFDHHWDIQSFGNKEGDKNAYSVGKIGCHNVVLVHMPGMGRTPAATVATSCRTSFPGIILALVVGICGAVPFYRPSTEIVLGDVVISDRLVIYDFGRQFPDKFMRKEEMQDSARKPPELIRNFLSKIKVRMHRDILRSKTGSHLETLVRNGWPSYPGATEDRLFEPLYRHKHQNQPECTQCTAPESMCDRARISTCDTLGCDVTQLVARQRHSHIASDSNNWLPEIHFGAYGSGDRVMKSGEHRDEIAEREEIIAFEMEGAGVWEVFPCVIIKGVCDYADSHKNKKWQDYAAVTAAACLKGFLEIWPARSAL